MEILIDHPERLQGKSKIRRKRPGAIVPKGYSEIKYFEEIRVLAERLIEEGKIHGPITLDTIQDLKEQITIGCLIREGRMEEAKAIMGQRRNRKQTTHQ